MDNEERWAKVDDYLQQLFLSPDPVLDAALEASDAAGLPAIGVTPPLVGERAGPFDVILIDADKRRYSEFFEGAMRLAHEGR